MYFNARTIKKIRKLAKDKRFNRFFDNISKQEDPDAKELLDELTGICVAELGIDWDDLDKVRYFLKLGYLTHE